MEIADSYASPTPNLASSSPTQANLGQLCKSGNIVREADAGESQTETSDGQRQEASDAPDDRKSNLVLPVGAEVLEEATKLARNPRHSYAEAMQLCVTNIAVCVEKEYAANRYKHSGNTPLRLVLAELLLSLPDALLPAIVHEDLPQRFHTRRDPDIVALFKQDPHWVNPSASPFCPGIYIIYLVNSKWENPTAEQCARLVQLLRQYVSGRPEDASTAKSIDNVRKRFSSSYDIEHGAPHYLQGHVRRVKIILTFCVALERRIAEVKEEDRSKPMAKPFSYVAYSLTPRARKDNHRATETNWLMHLVWDVLTYEFGYESFQMDSYVICYIVEEEEAKPAEVLFTIITDSVHETGGGFAVFQPGVQVSSAHNLTEEHWEDCKQFRTSPQFYKRCEKENEAIKAFMAGRRRWAGMGDMSIEERDKWMSEKSNRISDEEYAAQLKREQEAKKAQDDALNKLRQLDEDLAKDVCELLHIADEG